MFVSEPVKPQTPPVEEKPQKPSFRAEKVELFNEESLMDVLSTAFPKEDNDDDDDGFTFI